MTDALPAGHPKSEISNRDFARILILKPSAIGDVVHTLPVLNLLRKRFPAAHIAWLVTPACAGVLQGHPQLDDLILFERKRWSAWWRHPSRFLELRRFIRSLHARKFDLVLDFQGLFRSGWLARRSKAPVRVGFASAREFAWAFYTHRVHIDTPEQHAIDRYLTLARSIGCDDHPIEYIFPHDDADRADASSLAPRPCALLAPGTNWPTKRWPIERFAALPHLLKQRFDLDTIVIGGDAERELASRIPHAANLAGQTTLRQLCALIERAAVVISNDSGPMHIAAAMNRPLVALFGPTNPTRTGPHNRPDAVLRLDIPCAPCYSRHCSHQSCLQWIQVEPVLRAVEQQLRTPPTRLRTSFPANAPETPAPPR